MSDRQKGKLNRGRFPEEAVRKMLSDFWKKEMKDKEEDPFADSSGTLDDLLPPLGSLTIVRSFNQISKLLDMKIPVKLIKKGGYESHDQMINDLLPKLQDFYEKRKTKITA